MKIRNIKIYYVKKKDYKPNFPKPYFYREGFIFIKLISYDDLEGYGEPSPYLNNQPKKLISNIVSIFDRYFKNKIVDLKYVHKLKHQIKSNSLNIILPAFEHAIYDIEGKTKKKNVSKLLNKKNLSHLKFYASGGMIFENQSYKLLIKEALKAKSDGFYGYKFRPKLPKINLNHFQRIKKPPKIDLKELENFSYELRTKIGNNFKIMVDLGCRINSDKEADYLFKIFKEYDYFFVEEPYKRSQSMYKKFIKYKNNVKIAGGEHISSKEEFTNWKNKNYFDFYQPDTNLLLFEELNSIIKNINLNKIILHNWCNRINFLSNINFAFSLKKKILIEKNVIPNPFDEIFNSVPFKIKNGNLNFKKSKGFEISLKKKQNKSYDIYEKKI